MAQACMIPIGTLSNLADRPPAPAESAAEKRLEDHVDGCPECQRKLASLRRLHSLAQTSLREETQEQEKNIPWLDSLLDNLVLEARAGRSIPISSDSPAVKLSQAEGAVVAAIRAAADRMDGLILGRCRLVGDVHIPGAPVQVQVSVSVTLGTPIPRVTGELRDLIRRELARVSELTVTDIDITVQDLLTGEERG